MSTLVVTGRFEIVSDFIGPLAFNGWATLTNRQSGVRSVAIPVERWTRVVDAMGIYDAAALRFMPAADIIYDAWALSVDAVAEPFLIFPLPAANTARAGEPVEIEARLAHWSVTG